MPVASFGSGRQQRSHPLPQVVRNKISTHSDTLPTKIVQRKTRSSTHSETISKAPKNYHNEWKLQQHGLAQRPYCAG